MRKAIIALALMLGTTANLSAREYEMNYEVSFDTASHYIDVRLDYIPQSPLGQETVLLKMPVWAPGYYQIVDFPKYLTDFQTSAANGTTTTWQKVGKNGWKVSAPQADTLRVTYRIFANARSVVDCRVEDNAAFIAPNGVFMHQDGDIRHAANIHFTLPSNWPTISTGLPCTGAGQYRSDDFDQLYDSPFFIGNHYTTCFEYEGHPYEFALETPDGFEESPVLDDFKRMVSAATNLMQDVPYDNYCLIHMGKGGGGLEHRNSQACYSEGTWRFPDRAEYINYMGFITHEYFHLYNVKDIRPIELGPFDYDREAITPMLWVSEGFTVYYETQLMLRAGIINSDELLKELSGYIQDIETNEGQQHMSLRQSSYDIWLNFFNQNENRHKVIISYYIKGPVIGLVFDAMLRSETDGKASLDDVMRLLYNRYYKELGRGFTEEEFWQATEQVAATGKAAASAHETTAYLRNLVDTTSPIDYDAVLSRVGLQLNHDTWQLSMQPKPTKQALRLRQAMLGK